jgi:hypothetical protein
LRVDNNLKINNRILSINIAIKVIIKKSAVNPAKFCKIKSLSLKGLWFIQFFIKKNATVKNEKTSDPPKLTQIQLCPRLFVFLLITYR